MIFPQSINLYHGTTESASLNIEKDGFRCSDKNYSYYLSAYGIYFVVNRPLIATRFALKSNEPIVLKVSLKDIPKERILDLTTDEGMNILWETYDNLKKAGFDLKRMTKELKNTSHEPLKIKYLKSKIDINPMKDILGSTKRWRKDSASKIKIFNADSVVLDHLSRYYILIISSVNEGVTLQKKFTFSEAKYKSVKGYKGIQARNHIEVCVTNTDYILKESIEKVVIDKNLYHSNFYSHVTSEK